MAKRPGEPLPLSWSEFHLWWRLCQSLAYLFFQNILNQNALEVIMGISWSNSCHFVPACQAMCLPGVGYWRDITWRSVPPFYYIIHATVGGCNYETPQHLQSSLVVKLDTHLWHHRCPDPVVLLAPWTTPRMLHSDCLLCSGSAANECGDRYACPLETPICPETHSRGDVAIQSSWESMKYQWATWKLAAAEVEESLWVSSNSLWYYEKWWLLCMLILKVC